MEFYLHIAGFIFCSSIIIFSGTKLSYYGERIADLTGMGRAWVGLILMASVTSLPELITGISSVSIVNAPDLAAGDIMGSCVFNLLILSFLDARIKQPLFSLVKSSHIVAAIFSIILLMVAGISIYLAGEIPMIFWISASSVVLFAVYLASVWGIFKYEHLVQLSPDEGTVPVRVEPGELKKVIGRYAFNALVVISAALFLPFFGEKIAAYSGMGESFFGTLFIAASTSLPELVVSLAALRMGALDMAVGNLLGSNVFNMYILGIDDVFYKHGSLYRDISSNHLLSIFVTIIMTAVVGLGLLFRPKRKQMWLLSADAFILVFLYVLLMTYLYFKR